MRRRRAARCPAPPSRSYRAIVSASASRSYVRAHKQFLAEAVMVGSAGPTLLPSCHANPSSFLSSQPQYGCESALVNKWIRKGTAWVCEMNENLYTYIPMRGRSQTVQPQPEWKMRIISSGRPYTAAAAVRTRMHARTQIHTQARKHIHARKHARRTGTSS